jgi:hypothetical protein
MYVFIFKKKMYTKKKLIIFLLLNEQKNCDIKILKNPWRYFEPHSFL